MKSKILSITLLAGGLLGAQAQLAPNLPSAVGVERPSGYRSVQAGANFSLWLRVAAATNNGVITLLSTNAYTLISPGQNIWTGQNWSPARPELIVTNNMIIGRGAQAEARFANEINTTAAVQIRINGTSPPQYLKTHVLGLAFETPETNLVIATLKDSSAELPGTNSTRILYRDCLAGNGVRGEPRIRIFGRWGIPVADNL